MIFGIDVISFFELIFFIVVILAGGYYAVRVIVPRIYNSMQRVQTNLSLRGLQAAQGYSQQLNNLLKPPSEEET
mgnify:CR=1 FL=1